MHTKLIGCWYNNKLMEIRKEENGPLQFHKGTELKLLDYVLKNAEHGNPQSVIETVDKFCWENHWMMHLGDEKGAILDETLNGNNYKFALEMGAYCGYSAVRIASQLASDGHLYSIEYSNYHKQVAEQIVHVAGLNDKVTILNGKCEKVIPILSDHIKDNKFDYVFIDHEKSRYYEDLKMVEDYGLLHTGSKVVADNVIIFKIDDYLEHVRNSGKYSSSENRLAKLEYCEDTSQQFVDGMEISIFK